MPASFATAQDLQPISIEWGEPHITQNGKLLRISPIASKGKEFLRRFWLWWNRAPKVVYRLKSWGLKAVRNAATNRYELQWWRDGDWDMDPPRWLVWKPEELTIEEPDYNPILPLLEGEKPKRKKGRKKKERESEFEADMAVHEVTEEMTREALNPPPLKNEDELYDYQILHARTIHLSLQANGFALDASDTGTGKTYVACKVARSLGKKLLVISPLAVCQSWERCMNHFQVQGEVINYEKVRNGNSPHGHWEPKEKYHPPDPNHPDGEKQKKKKVRNRKFIWTLPNEIDLFSKHESGWLVVFDEVQKAKSPDSDQGAMLRFAAWQNIQVLMLSATSAKDPTEMRNSGAVLRLHTGKRGAWEEWCNQNGCAKGGFGVKFVVSGQAAKKNLDRIHGSIFPVKGSRMRISELGDKFPKNQTHAVAWRVSAEDRKQIDAAYEEAERKADEIMMDTSLTNFQKSSCILVEMLRARQAAERIKWPYIAEKAQDYIDEGCSPVIALNFRENIVACARQLGCSYQVILGTHLDGSTQKPDERQRLIDRFQADQIRFLVVSLQAGGTGISLHDLNGNHPRRSLISPSFSAIDLKQFLGRIWRAGALTPSIQEIIFAAGTIEEQACRAVQEKLINIERLNDGELASGIRFLGG